MGKIEQSVWLDDANTTSYTTEGSAAGVKANRGSAAGTPAAGAIAGITPGATAGIAPGATAGTIPGTAGTIPGIIPSTTAGTTPGAVSGIVSGAGAATQGNRLRMDTEETSRLKENYGFFAAAAFAYAVFYAFCMYENGSGITFLFFVVGSLVFLRLGSPKLGITLKKGSGFYMAAMVLLGISTFCTDDFRIIFFNKLGVLLLMMSLLLKQFCNTEKWKLGKYLFSICELIIASIGELERPFQDGRLYWKSRSCKLDKRVGYFILGLIIGLPILLVVLLLLASADAVFRQITWDVLKAISLVDIFKVLLIIAFVFFATYGIIALLCKKVIKDEVKDRRNGEPVLAITITVLLTLLYLLFCGIQIAGLFLGKLQLPEGYTYAMYARQGFFQLLVVGFLNLIIVLACMTFFKESKVLKGVLTVMSICTFVMIASSVTRMVIYIRYYYLTFLRILVLWGLLLLAVLFVGVVINIFYEHFPLFRYSMAVVAILYLALSFSHPDYIIAKVNVANAHNVQPFFLANEPYHDYAYLRGLCADAAPVLVPYLEELGYHMEAFQAEDAVDYAASIGAGKYSTRSSQEAFGYYWMEHMQQRTKNLGIRTYNVSRHLAVSRIRKAADK